MICYQPIHHPIIYVYHQKLLDKALECGNYDPGEYHRCILESKWYHCVLKASKFSHKGCLMLILLRNIDLMIAGKSIRE